MLHVQVDSRQLLKTYLRLILGIKNEYAKGEAADLGVINRDAGGALGIIVRLAQIEAGNPGYANCKRLHSAYLRKIGKDGVLGAKEAFEQLRLAVVELGEMRKIAGERQTNAFMTEKFDRSKLTEKRQDEEQSLNIFQPPKSITFDTNLRTAKRKKSGGVFSKRNIITGGLLFFSGVTDGFGEGLKYRYTSFKRVFPGADDQFWNPDKSWSNKYKDGDPEKGEKFPLSTTLLVGATDGYHLMRTMRSLSAAAAITIRLGGKKKWHQYLLEGAAYYAIERAGYLATYELLLRK